MTDPQKTAAPLLRRQRRPSQAQAETKSWRVTPKKVKKTINKLRYQQHEERRQREEAERLREEAIKVAQQYAEQSKQYHKIIQEGEQYLVHQIRERASMAVDQAKNSYRQAYEEGNDRTRFLKRKRR